MQGMERRKGEGKMMWIAGLFVIVLLFVIASVMGGDI